MSDKLFVPITPPKATAVPLIPAAAETTEIPASKARLACFAIVSDLTSRFETATISNDDVWNWVRTSHGVESRSEMTEKMWAITQARLSAAQKNESVFSVLCHNIQQTSIKVDVEFSVESRKYPQASKVDVVLESGQRYSHALVDTQKKTVRGREFEIRRIVAHITSNDTKSMTRKMCDQAVLTYVLESVKPTTEPTEDAVKEILIDASQWLMLDSIAEKLSCEDTESILVVLRVLYRQKQIVHKQIGDNRWFRTSVGY